MCRKLIYLVSFVFVLGLVMPSVANAVDPDLVGWWKLDETFGTTAADSSDNGNDGTLQGGGTWVAGQIGGAWQGDGTDDYIELGNPSALNLSGAGQATIAAWVNMAVSKNHNSIFTKGEWNDACSLLIKGDTSPANRLWTGNDTSIFSADPIPIGVWTHVAVTINGNLANFYINGTLNGPANQNRGGPIDNPALTAAIGREDRSGSDDRWYFNGMLDDVRIYSRVLTVEEIEVIMLGEGGMIATKETPADGEIIDNNEVQLRWDGADGAISHDVYFGTSFDDVNDADNDSDEFMGNTTDEEYPYGDVIRNLVYGQTYHWRIDEVNNLADPNVWKGRVWSFTVRPYGTWDPFPSDGATFVPTDVTCTWKVGTVLDGVSGYYDVFFGTDFNDVNEAEYGDDEWLAELPKAIPWVTPSEFVTVEKDTVYFWRVASWISNPDPPPDYITLDRGTVWSFTTLPYIPVHADPNFVGWWTFDEDVGITTACDWTGNGNDGTINGGLERVPGIYDNAMDYPGGGDYVELPTSMVDSSIGSVCMWIKTTQSSRGHLFFGTNDAGNGWGDEQELHVSMETGGGIDFWITGATTNVEIGSPPVNDDEWHHIAATWESPGDAKLYVDGGTPLTQAHTGDIFSFTFCIRLGMPWDPERYFDGLMDDVRLYKRVLTDAEIKDMGTPETAHNPNPTKNKALDPVDFTNCSWGAGKHAYEHNVYFSTDFALVDGRNAGIKTIVPMPTTSYTPSPALDYGKVYYWAVDAVNDVNGPAPYLWSGKVWSFKTIRVSGHGSIRREVFQNVPTGAGTIDDFLNDPCYPGHPNIVENIPTFEGPVNWDDQYGTRIHGYLHPETAGDYRFWLSSDDDGELWLSTDDDPGNAVRIAFETGLSGSRDWQSGNEDSDWITLAAGGKYYICALHREGSGGDNIAVAWQGPDQPIAPADGLADAIIDGYFLSPFLPLWAYGPYPRNGSTIDDREPNLTWVPGLYVQDVNEHELYFSASFADVDNRTAPKITLTDPLYPVPGPLALGQTYYWAVDEVNTTHTDVRWYGNVWSFSITDCISLDNMEDYNDRGEMRGVWTDGYASVGWSGSVPLNTASSGSNLDVSTSLTVGSPSGTTGPIHGGSQTMVLRYDNDSNTYTGLAGEEDLWYWADYFSEIEANTVENLGLSVYEKNWSGDGIQSLTMWFQGHPVSDGSSDFGSWPGFWVTGRGRDIWGGHDEFYFLGLYPWIPPASTTFIETQVVRMDYTNSDAKAGLMIREKMTPYSRFVAVYVTPGNGVFFQWRDSEGGVCTQAEEQPSSVTAPVYLRLERSALGAFTASYSNDSNSWADVNVRPGVNYIDVPMDESSLYAGVVVTSHDGAQLCRADFNNWDANPWPASWVWGNVGLNAPEQLYVALDDGINPVSVVEHSDVNAATLTTWQEWNIKLSDFSGVDMNNVEKIYIGLGDRDAPVVGGSGAIYIDDIRACPPRCVPSEAKPDYDIAEPYDCIVDEKDLLVMADDWMLGDELIDTIAPNPAGLVAYWPLDTDFNDYSGHGFHADPNGGAALVSDANRGQVLRLYSDGDFVNCGNPTEPNALDFGTGNWTVCAWVKTTMSGTGDGDESKGVIYAKGGDHSGGHRYGLYVNENQSPTQGRLALVVDDNATTVMIDGSVINDGEWHHVAGLRNVNDLRLYLDGLPDGTATLPAGYDLSGTHQHNAYIGAITNHDANSDGSVLEKWLQGSIEDVRIYEFALSPEEVAYLAVDGAPELHSPIVSPADVYTGEAQGNQWINLKDYSLIASKYLEEVLWP